MFCRAYSTYTDDEINFQYLNRRPLKPNYNISPTHNVPTLRDRLDASLLAS